MLWMNGRTELDTSRLAEDAAALLESAMVHCAENAYAQMTLLALLAPLFYETDGTLELSPEGLKQWRKVRRILGHNLNPDASLGQCLQFIGNAALRVKGDCNPYDRGYWAADAAAAVEAMRDQATLPELVLAILEALDLSQDREVALFRSLLAVKTAAAALAGKAEPLSLFNQDGTLERQSFSHGGMLLLENAAVAAGGKELLPLHLLHAMLAESDGYAAQVLRQANSNSDAFSARAKLRALLDSGAAKPPEGEKAGGLEKSMFSPPMILLLEGAAESAEEANARHIDEKFLFVQLLQSRDEGTQSLMRNLLQWPVEDLLEIAFRYGCNPLYASLPLGLCECENLSLRGDGPVLAPCPDVTDRIIQFLYRKDCHNVALYGERGVGKTACAQLLAQALPAADAPQLRVTPVVYLDCDSIAEGQTEAKLPQIFTFMEEHPRPIYVLDNVGPLLEPNHDDRTGKPSPALRVCLRRLAKNPYKCVIILDREGKKRLEEQAHIKIAHLLEVEEPKEETVKGMLAARLPQIAREFSVQFEPNLEPYALRLAANYIMSRRFPQKVIALLESAAAEACARVALKGGDTPNVGRKDLAVQIAAETGLPVETILGTGQDKDYVYLLSRSLMGQEHAVNKVAARMDLIQKGRVNKKLPAAIFFFAGLSGTGKTELAKQVASLYSSSRTLITYEMSTMSEAHSVSALVGSPPGYAGYEEGGKLINDLNKDPYSVLLFDEVEKAHPALFDPLMPLLDEGVITDKRGVKAFSNKAFIVLTSNIGQYEIAKMLREGRCVEEIEEAVTRMIVEHRSDITGKVLFRPEILNRIERSGGIIIFNALSLEALEGITRHMANRTIAEEMEIHGYKLEIDDEVIATIAKSAYDENDAALRQNNLYKGGRNIDGLFNRMVQEKLSRANLAQLASARLVRIVMDGSKTALVPITDETEVDRLVQKRRQLALGRVEERLNRICTVESGALEALSDERLAKLDVLLAEAGIMTGV